MENLGNNIQNENAPNILLNIFGSVQPRCIVGPCAVENYEMMDKITKYLVSKNVYTIRAGAFKPRTSPDDFQGLGVQALQILDRIKTKYHVKIVSEIVDTRHIHTMYDIVDIFQVGARNMYNYELLKALGKTKKPVILKRGLSATLDELIYAAAYIIKGGNDKIVLCERGIRSYDTKTRNLLDLSCVALIKKETDFPIVVDISHSLGRKDIALVMAKSALAAGADGIMVEVHHNPNIALSDAKQQMSLLEFDHFYNELLFTYDCNGVTW